MFFVKECKRVLHHQAYLQILLFWGFFWSGGGGEGLQLKSIDIFLIFSTKAYTVDTLRSSSLRCF